MNEYEDDLARIHHEGHGDLARQAGPAIVGHLRRAGIRHGLVVDLGCGSGILARYLSNRGYDVLGVDASPAMLRIARQIAPAARFVRSRAEDLTLPPSVAVVATGEALTYLSARDEPVAHLRRHIQRVSSALMPGGVFIFDAIVEGRSRPMSYRTWRAGREWAVLVDVAEDLRRHVVRRRITTFARSRSTYRRSHAEHRVGVYSRTRVLQELRASGFVAHMLRGYGATPLPARRVVFSAHLTDTSSSKMR
jgi:SAM-dependent methyltransferase